MKDLLRNEMGQITLIQFVYNDKREYHQPEAKYKNIRCEYTLITNKNSTVGKIKDLSEEKMITTGIDIYFHFCKLIPNSIFLRKLPTLNQWFCISSKYPNGYITSTKSIFYFLNECYPEDREGYTIEEWNDFNEKRLISHMRRYANDIDGFIVDDNNTIIEAFEAKKDIKLFEDIKKHPVKKWHYEGRQIWVLHYLGNELREVLETEVYK